MILIKRIECVQVDGDMVSIMSHSPLSMPHFPVRNELGEEAFVDTRELHQELVRGRLFRRPDGTEVVIGMSEQCQDLIGLQYEAWDNTLNNVDRLMAREQALVKKNNQISQRLADIHTAPWWRRLRWLFAGIEG